jgi:hypothetical protein
MTLIVIISGVYSFSLTLIDSLDTLAVSMATLIASEQFFVPFFSSCIHYEATFPCFSHPVLIYDEFSPHLPCLQVMGKDGLFLDSVARVIRVVRFDSDFVVSVFETNIRVLAGLLSAHLFVKEVVLGSLFV